MSAKLKLKRCPNCGAPCQKNKDHDGRHNCINCGAQWYWEIGQKPFESKQSNGYWTYQFFKSLNIIKNDKS